MKLYKFVFFIILSFPYEALTAPIFLKVSDLDFDQVTPKYGECEMDFDTGVITDRFASTLCAYSSTGTPAQFRLFGAINQSYDIQVTELYIDGTGGYSFDMSGEASSDIQTVTVVEGSYVTINSGSSGIIDIKVGGILSINSDAGLTGGQDYAVEEVISVGWRETP